MTCSAMATVGTRAMYMISASGAGGLSAVAWPAVRLASLTDQLSPDGRRYSRAALPCRNICTTASFAPGARGAAWDAGIGESAPPPGQVSGRSQRKR
jgi:hypothetical protein